MAEKAANIWKILGINREFASKSYLGRRIGEVLSVSVNNEPFLTALQALDVQDILSKPSSGNGRGYDRQDLAFEHQGLYVLANIGKLEPQEEDSPLAKFIKEKFERTNERKDDWTVLKLKTHST